MSKMHLAKNPNEIVNSKIQTSEKRKQQKFDPCLLQQTKGIQLVAANFMQVKK